MAAANSSRSERQRHFLREEAVRCGFETVRVTLPTGMESAKQHLADYLEKQHHGDMTWMLDTFLRRSDPTELWPDVRSIAVFAMNYGPDHDPMSNLDHPNQGNISVYARNRDYHDVMKGRLKEIAGRFAARFGVDVKIFVDTAPVMEKPLAEMAGIGWQGKHTNLVSRNAGSWLFLGSIFIADELEPDTRESDRCGKCRSCLDVCPTNAFPAPYQLDARRCISYLTIELKEMIPQEFRRSIGNRIYGCDDCLAVCPWNKFAKTAAEIKLQPRADLLGPDLGHLLTLDDAEFRQLFSGSPIKRIGRDRFLRNVLVAVGNSKNRTYLPACRKLLIDTSPIVRASAVWAIYELSTAMEWADIVSCLADEVDPLVRREVDLLSHHTGS